MTLKFDFFNGQQGAALKELVQTLWSKGFVVYLAGGAVRDFLLGRKYKDLDIVTDASVEQVQKLFPKTVPVGIQFGIVRVIINGFEFEVARFRSDGPYQDGRHPNSVEFSSPKEDAERRDFTINALFYDFKTNQIIDYVNGESDLKKQLIKTVGDPEKRFTEDHLRILRSLRFACQLKFKIDNETEKAAQKMISSLRKVSGERLLTELVKMLSADSEKAFHYFIKWDIIPVFFPHWKISDINTKGPYLTGSEDAGILLAQLIFCFHQKWALGSLQVESSTSWKFQAEYLQIVNDITKKFRLSRIDCHHLKLAGTVYAWPQVWFQLRVGYRRSFIQSEDFQWIFFVAQKLSLWTEPMLTEIQRLKHNPPLQCVLLGKDVLSIAPDHRGLVLSECLYLQYEGIISSRNEALSYFKNQLKGE